jgi:hypothetical protein
MVISEAEQSISMVNIICGMFPTIWKMKCNQRPPKTFLEHLTQIMERFCFYHCNSVSFPNNNLKDSMESSAFIGVCIWMVKLDWQLFHFGCYVTLSHFYYVTNIIFLLSVGTECTVSVMYYLLVICTCYVYSKSRILFTYLICTYYMYSSRISNVCQDGPQTWLCVLCVQFISA